jgi:hypothetical protein
MSGRSWLYRTNGLMALSYALWRSGKRTRVRMSETRVAICALRVSAPMNIRLGIVGPSPEPRVVASLLTALETRDSTWLQSDTQAFLDSWPIGAERDSIFAQLRAMRTESKVSSQLRL